MPRTPAPEMAIIASKSEKWALSVLLYPKNLAAVIVMPERLVPGMRASDCDNPIMRLSLSDISFKDLFFFVFLSATHNKMPKMVVEIAMILSIRSHAG